jgi:hypothetical protein
MEIQSIEKSETILPGIAVEWALLFKRNTITMRLLSGIE